MLEEEKNIIKVNRKELSTKEVREKENIGAILNKHRMITKRPVYKQKRFYYFLFLAIVVALLLYYAEKEEGDNPPQQIEETR